MPNKLASMLYDLFSGLKGLLGLTVRFVLINRLLNKCGENVSIHSNVYIFNPNNISIGDNVSIHPMSYIEGSGGINIGNDVSIAHSTSILSTEHRYSLKDIPIKDQGIDNRPVNIHDNVWIGAKSTILSGVTINSGCIIAAGAVVTKSIPENSVAAGVPATVIKSR